MSTHTQDHAQYEWAKAEFAKARDPYAGRPLLNNTRLVETAEGYGVRLHATVVVEYLPNGNERLRTGGWFTVTTRGRIQSYSVAKVYTEHGSWYVETRPRDDDPEPARQWNEIHKPFTATNPGDRPEHECTRADGSYYWCAECSRYDSAHDSWARYVEYIDRFGSPSAWQDAYRLGMRAQRAASKLAREWRERNRVAFFDGIEIEPDGYVSRRSLQRARKEAREAAKSARRREAERKRYAREAARKRREIERAAKAWSNGLAVEVREEVAAWCVENGLTPNADGTVTLVKAVGPDYRSNHGALYAPGSTVVADDYSPEASCGRGLHFGPSEEVSGRYHTGGPATFVRCRVPVATLIPLQDKCKADRCYVEPTDEEGR